MKSIIASLTGVFFALLLVAINVAVMGLFFELLWNSCVVAVFNLPTLTYLHAAGLYAILQFIIKQERPLISATTKN